MYILAEIFAILNITSAWKEEAVAVSGIPVIPGLTLSEVLSTVLYCTTVGMLNKSGYACRNDTGVDVIPRKGS